MHNWRSSWRSAVATELRYAPAEWREAADGPGIIAGVVVRYGDVARVPGGRERIVAGAFNPLPQAGRMRANVQHTRERPVAVLGRGLTLHDSAAELRAEIVLPKTRDAEDVAELYRQNVE